MTTFPCSSPSRQMWVFAAVLGIGGACTKQSPPTPPASADATAEEATPDPRIDATRMLSLLEALASDDLGGRYTLSPDISSAADLVAQGWAESGVKPVGEGYTTSFTVVTGVKPKGVPVLTVGGKAVAERAFAPLPSSGSGDVTAQAVFVGYAATGSDDEGNVTYDDLEGIDLQGKIAVVFEELPSSPNFREFFGAVRAQTEAFEAKAASLREAGKTKALAKKHVEARKAVAKIANRYLHRPLPDDFSRAPEDPSSELSSRKLISAIMFHAGQSEGPDFSRQLARTSSKLDRLVEAGAAGVIFVKGQRTFVSKEDRTADELPDAQGRSGRPIRKRYDIPVVQLKWKDADKLFNKSSKLSKLQKEIDVELAPRSRPLDVEVALEAEIEHEVAEVPNVIGYIPGTDNADEIVLIGAHYDHIGRDEGGPGHCRAKDGDDICNGADDNGSGTVVVAEMARAMAETGFAPKRTLVFALFAGEELGLLGSSAMAEQLPTAAPFDTGKVVAMINIDMVGRLRPDRGLAIGGVGSSSGWMPLLDGLDARGIPIMFDRSVTTRSDHASFYRHDIPVLFFFTHVHDDYHGPGDEMAEINRDGMAKIADYVLDATRIVADGAQLPFTKPDGADQGLVGALPGDNPDTIVKKIGFNAPPPSSPPPPSPPPGEQSRSGAKAPPAGTPTPSHP